MELPHISSAELRQTRDKLLEYAEESAERRKDFSNLSEEFEYHACK